MYAWARRRLTRWPALIADDRARLLARAPRDGVQPRRACRGRAVRADALGVPCRGRALAGSPTGPWPNGEDLAALGLALLLAACAMTQAGLALWFGIVALATSRGIRPCALRTHITRSMALAGLGGGACWPSCCSCPSWRPSGRRARRSRTHSAQALGAQGDFAQQQPPSTHRRAHLASRPEGWAWASSRPCAGAPGVRGAASAARLCDCAGAQRTSACAGTPLGRSSCWCSCLRPLRAALACAAVPVPHGHPAVAAAPACGPGLPGWPGWARRGSRALARMGPGRPASTRRAPPCRRRPDHHPGARRAAGPAPGHGQRPGPDRAAGDLRR